MAEHRTTTISFSDSTPADTSGDALVLGMTKVQGEVRLADGHGLSEETASHLNDALAALGAEAGAEECHKLVGVPGVGSPLTVVVSLPAQSQAGREEVLRRAAGVAARALGGKDRAVFALGQQDAQESAAVAEGAALGAYVFAEFHGTAKEDSAKVALGEAVVLGADPGSQVGAVLDAVRYARDLVNTPPNVLYPETFAASIVEEAARVDGITAEVWEPERLKEEGCGGILGVGQGSARGPRLVTLTYAPEGAQKHLALVGKGITFDSGGLCIKPGGSMVTMKMDMAGAASVAAAMLAIARIGLPVKVTGFLCLAENMTGDLAQRPGDVVTMRDGRSVEIINTDAEGRLVMADGLALATEAQPDAIVDVATLTGACIIALGERTIGVMGNDDELRDQVTALGNQVGDTSWSLPLPEEIRPTLDTTVADLKHTGERSAGAMVAATFLAEFVGTRGEGADASPIPWAHLDIAGPAYNEKSPWGYYPKGATGQPVRTLVALARAMSV